MTTRKKRIRRRLLKGTLDFEYRITKDVPFKKARVVFEKRRLASLAHAPLIAWVGVLIDFLEVQMKCNDPEVMNLSLTKEYDVGEKEVIDYSFPKVDNELCKRAVKRLKKARGK